MQCGDLLKAKGKNGETLYGVVTTNDHCLGSGYVVIQWVEEGRRYSYFIKYEDFSKLDVELEEKRSGKGMIEFDCEKNEWKFIGQNYNKTMGPILYELRANETIAYDNVSHPSHYCNGKYECLDVMEDVFGKDAVMNFCLLNTFKYVWRHSKKNGKEDLEKAAFYLNKAIGMYGEDS